MYECVCVKGVRRVFVVFVVVVAGFVGKELGCQHGKVKNDSAEISSQI